MNKSDYHHTRKSLKYHCTSQTGVKQPACLFACLTVTVLWDTCELCRAFLKKGFVIISDGFHCGLRPWGDHFLSGHFVTFYVCFGGHLAGHCACVLPGEILYILPKLATMSALCSWHDCCLGWVIWWLDRNNQGLLTGSLFICVFCKINKN